MAELGFEPRQLGMMLPLQVEATLAQGGRVHTIRVRTVDGVVSWWDQGPSGEPCRGCVSKTVALQVWDLGSNSALRLMDHFFNHFKS